MANTETISTEHMEGLHTTDPLLRGSTCQNPQSRYLHLSNRPTRPLGLGFRSSKAFITFVACVAVFTDTFLYSLIIPILPDTLMQRASVPREDVQIWLSILLGVYGAANIAVSPIAGYLADRAATRKGPLLFGICVLTFSTAMFCFGTTLFTLIVARALQGAAATVLYVCSMALLSDTMGASTAGAAMGWQSIGKLVGVALGPSLGGVVFDLYGHFAVFGMAFGLLAVDAVLRLVMIERKVADEWLSVSQVMNYGTNQPSEAGSHAREDAIGRSLDLQTKVRTKATESSSTPSTIDLIRNSRILMALWAQFLASLSVTALESVLPLYTKDLFSWTPARSGMLFTLFAFSIIVDPFIGHLTDRQGPRILFISGLLVSTFLWIIFSLITSNSMEDKILLCVLILAIGFSIGLVATPNMIEISLAVDDMNKSTAGGFATEKVIGRAYSFVNMSYGIGSILGPLWGATVIQSSGWPVLCISFAVLNAVSVGFAYFFSGKHTEKKVVLGVPAVVV